jgi:hypothetical protein
MGAAAARSARGASAGIDGLTATMVKGAAAGTVLGHAFEQAVGWLKEYGAEIVKYAARTQTLGVVTNQLAKVNDYNAASVNRLVDRIKHLEIRHQATSLSEIDPSSVHPGIISWRLCSGLVHPMRRCGDFELLLSISPCCWPRPCRTGCRKFIWPALSPRSFAN